MSKVPLKCIISASNELPIDDEELKALYDRFLIRVVVDYVKENNFLALLKSNNDKFEIPEEFKLSIQELERIKVESEKVKVSDDIYICLRDIKFKIDKIFKDDSSEHISDRRIKKMIKLLKVSAYTNERNYVDFTDIYILCNSMWNNLKNIDEIRKIIEEQVKKISFNYLRCCDNGEKTETPQEKIKQNIWL